MTIYFVSSADGSDSDNGTTLDLAWATIEHALEAGSLSAGDSVAVRRTHSEIPISDIVPIYDGTPANPIKLFGCPRSAHAISSSDWTNGSAAVVVDDADMSRSEHQARYIDAPDGNRYLITRVVDASNIVIDREYAGSTVSNDATASIHADTVQTTWDDYDDSSDTIKKSAWEADADTLPVIDFNDAAYQLDANGDHNHSIYCIELKDSSDTNGVIILRSVWYMEGCLFKQTTQNTEVFVTQFSNMFIKRCIFEGSGSGSSQIGVYNNSGFLSLEDSAIYNCGDRGYYQPNGKAQFKNVNIGVEIANGDDDINTSGEVSAIDLKLGGSNGLVSIVSGSSITGQVSIENYQKVFGDHRTHYVGGYYERVAVTGETPNKKISDYILKIVPNINVTLVPELAFVMLQHDIDGVTTGAKTFRYWIYNDTGATLNDTTALDNIWLKAEYVDSYDDTSEYTQTEIFSAQIDILDAADADDWDYLEVTINPAVASKVRLTIYISYYNASTNLFIDPAVVIS